MIAVFLNSRLNPFCIKLVCSTQRLKPIGTAILSSPRKSGLPPATLRALANYTSMMVYGTINASYQRAWAKYVASPAPAQPPNRLGNRASEPGRGYGAQFWLYENFSGVPDGTYAALGNRGQFVIIVPSRNVVIVRRGYDYGGQRFNGPTFTAEVLKHLP